MDFRWNGWNLEHIGAHGVTPDEAEKVVESTHDRNWIWRGDGKWLVPGRGYGGRLLQIVLILDPDGTVYVIHARPLTDTEKRRLRRSDR